MKPWLRRLAARLPGLGVLLLVLAAVAISALRLALPLADHYRDSLAELLARRLGHPVEVGALCVRLAGFTPRLTLERVTLRERPGGAALLALRSLELDLDPLDSLRLGSLQWRAMTLVGARLKVRRLADGRVQVAGLGALASDDPRALDLFLAQARLRLAASEILLTDEGSGGAGLRLADLDLEIDNDGERHRLALSARPEPLAGGVPADATASTPVDAPVGQGGAARLRVQARLAGDPAAPARWGGDLYLSLDGSDLAPLAAPAPIPESLATWLAPGRWHTAGVRFESWVRLQDGTLAQWLSRVRIQGLDLALPAAREPLPGVGGGGARGGRLSAATAGSAAAPAPRPRPVPSAAATSIQARPPALTLDRLAALVRVAPTAGGGWRLEVADLEMAADGGAQDGIGLDLRLSAAGRPERLDLAAPGLDLGAAARLARWAGRAVPGPLPAPLAQALALEPGGRLDELALRLDLPPDAAARWRLGAAGRDLALARHGEIPGFSGLTLQVRADQDGGALRLASEGLTLDLAPLFDRPLGFTQASGWLGWGRRPDGGWRLVARKLAAENADLHGQVRFMLDLPAPPSAPPSASSSAQGADGDDASPFLDLRASFGDLDWTRVRPYLPAGIMHESLIAWLDRALIAGRVVQGDVLMRGRLSDYPFRAREGRFEIVVGFEDGVLDFQEGWPRLKDLAGTLRFEDEGMEIEVGAGRLLDTRVVSAGASIPDLKLSSSMRIGAVGEGPLSDGLRVLAETPLSHRLGPLARALAVQGDARLALDLGIPLNPGVELTVDGRVVWPARASVALKGTPVALDRLEGELAFTADSVRAPGLRGELWGRPAELFIATRNPGSPLSSTTEIRARTRLPVKELAARLPSPAWRLASGELDLDLGVELRNADLQEARLPLALSLRSDLRGLALDLPAPLGKAARRPQALTLRADLVPGQRLGLQGGLGVLALNLDLDLAQGRARLEQGRIHLGGEPAAAPQAPGLAVDGDLAALDLPAWMTWWERVGEGLGPLVQVGGAGASAGAGARAAGLPSLDLRVGRLDLGPATLTKARIQAAPLAAGRTGGQGGGWVLDADARELKGRLTLPPSGSDRPLDLDLKRLDLKSLIAQDPPSAGPPRSRTPAEGRGGRLPAMQVRVEDLAWGDGRLGRLGFGLGPDELGTRVSGIDFQGQGGTVIAGDAAWIEGEDGGRSRLSLKLASADPGPLLSVVDSANAVSQAPLEAELRLEWPGGLGDFALARASGDIDFQLGAGRLPKVEPGVGRVLGFLNLGALSRRLTLDFRDIYEQGFSFERIAGRIRIGGGRATVQSFDIESPASRIRVAGYSDLRTRTFEQTATVEPSIGTGVAIAGAVAGGPAVGAAVYALNRVSGGLIDRLGSIQYRVTGPWTDPVFQPVGWEPFGQGQGGHAPPRPPAAGQPAKARGGATQREDGNPFLE